MIYILIALITWISIELFFFLTHRKPLNEKEIVKLAYKRRKKYIKTNYSFRLVNAFPEKNFKSSMKPQGKMYAANITLFSFPSYVSNLLKGKKHEWVVLAFVKNNEVQCFYANKGVDNSSVSFNVDISELIELCKTNGYQTIMRFHNHPNSDPQHYTHFLASEQDKSSARYISETVLTAGINWLDFVCERGRFLEFYRAFSETFFPEESNTSFIEASNGNAKIHYIMQRELGLFR